MQTAYSKILDVFEFIEKIFIFVFCAIMVVLMAGQVIQRYVFNAANSWSEELVRYLFIYTVMLGAAMATRRNSHLQIDVFINKLGIRAKSVFTIASTLAGILFLIFLFVYSLFLCKSALTNSSAGLKISMAIPYLSMPLGCVLIIFNSIEVVLNQIRQFVSSGDNLEGNKENKQ